jgi:ribokinase
MEVLVIGKPAVNVYLPLQEFPMEGDVFHITGKNESVGGVPATAACLIAKWGIKPHFTGVLGNDAYAEKIRNVFSEYKVNSKFLETTFEKPTSTNYLVLNLKTGAVTKILYNDPNVELQKFKYDFQPDWAIMDASDTAGAMALINNDNRVKIVFYARVANANTLTLAKKCKYVVCTQAFLEGLTKTKIEIDTPAEELVDAYQKLVDSVGSSNYVVLLNNKKILYAEDNKVKMLPEMKINHADVSSFDSVFTGAFAFAMMHDISLDDSIKFANTAAAISISKIGEEPAIPTLEEVITNSGLKDKFKSYQPEQKVEVPQQQVVEQAPVQQGEQPLAAFDQKPIGDETVQAPPVAEQQAPTAVETPVSVPQEPVQAPPTHEDTNIFG